MTNLQGALSLRLFAVSLFCGTMSVTPAKAEDRALIVDVEKYDEREGMWRSQPLIRSSLGEKGSNARSLAVANEAGVSE